jgi:hypothetical protein
MIVSPLLALLIAVWIEFPGLIVNVAANTGGTIIASTIINRHIRTRLYLFRIILSTTPASRTFGPELHEKKLNSLYETTVPSR